MGKAEVKSFFFLHIDRSMTKNKRETFPYKMAIPYNMAISQIKG